MRFHPRAQGRHVERALVAPLPFIIPENLAVREKDFLRIKIPFFNKQILVPLG